MQIGVAMCCAITFFTRNSEIKTSVVDQFRTSAMRKHRKEQRANLNCLIYSRTSFSTAQ